MDQVSMTISNLPAIKKNRKYIYISANNMNHDCLLSKNENNFNSIFIQYFFV